MLALLCGVPWAASRGSCSPTGITSGRAGTARRDFQLPPSATSPHRRSGGADGWVRGAARPARTGRTRAGRPRSSDRSAPQLCSARRRALLSKSAMSGERWAEPTRPAGRRCGSPGRRSSAWRPRPGPSKPDRRAARWVQPEHRQQRRADLLARPAPRLTLSLARPPQVLLPARDQSAVLRIKTRAQRKDTLPRLHVVGESATPCTRTPEGPATGRR